MGKPLNAYERAMLAIGERLLDLGGLVGRRLEEALSSLVTRDGNLARVVMEGDEEIDLLDEGLEMDALELISLQQPLDRELRFMAAATRISRELERIADYACDIAEEAVFLSGRGPYFKPLVDVPRMGEIVRGMMAESLEAYVKKNLAVARGMHDEDAEVDEFFRSLQMELTEYMKEGPQYVDQACALLLVARYLERIGDHVVNIAEMTIFAETGERHPFKTRKPGV